jgi:moderate conductance mechanosensitive channel
LTVQNPAASPGAAVSPDVLAITLALAFAAAGAAAAALTIGRIARRLLASTGHEPGKEPLAQRTVRAVRLMTLVLVFIVLAFPALDMAGVELPAGLQSHDFGRSAARTGVRIVSLLLLAFFVVRILSMVIVGVERDMSVGTGLDALERRKRAQTIAGILRRGLSTVIWTTAALMVLRELDVDITPVLTGAGIVGLAVGFGAQTLVRDIITGFFLIIEDQVRVGDVAMVNGTGGLVEQINLRTIVLRDFEGVVHVIPNGEIKTLANRTKDFSYYVIDLGVDYVDDTDRVTALIREAGADFAPFILEPVEVVGVDDFRESSVSVKLRIKTVPLKQWEVGRELRRRIKKVLSREGIRAPMPKLDVTLSRRLPPDEPPSG